MVAWIGEGAYGLCMSTRSNDWWSVLWDSGALALGVLGADRTYVEVNAALARLLEADASTITAWPYEQLGHPLDLDVELDAFVRLTESVGSVSYHRRFRTARGGEFTAEVRLWISADDQVLQMVVPGVVPQARGAEQLGRRLEQVGAALSHDALEAVRQASVQCGLLAELSAPQLDEGGKKTLANIERLALKAGRQLRALAVFARLAMPRINPEPVLLRPLIDAVWAEQTAIPPDAMMKIEMVDNARWRCDPLQFGSALRALLNNALAYREAARPLTLGVRVTITAEVCTVCVSDNGRGIAAIDQPRLFRVFATIGSDAGVGLGLASVQAIAEGHGGHAELASVPGQGTQVTFTLAS